MIPFVKVAVARYTAVEAISGSLTREISDCNTEIRNIYRPARFTGAGLSPPGRGPLKNWSRASREPKFMISEGKPPGAMPLTRTGMSLRANSVANATVRCSVAAFVVP